MNAIGRVVTGSIMALGLASGARASSAKPVARLPGTLAPEYYRDTLEKPLVEKIRDLQNWYAQSEENDFHFEDRPNEKRCINVESDIAFGIDPVFSPLEEKGFEGSVTFSGCGRPVYTVQVVVETATATSAVEYSALQRDLLAGRLPFALADHERTRTIVIENSTFTQPDIKRVVFRNARAEDGYDRKLSIIVDSIPLLYSSRRDSEAEFEETVFQLYPQNIAPDRRDFTYDADRAVLVWRRSREGVLTSLIPEVRSGPSLQRRKPVEVRQALKESVELPLVEGFLRAWIESLVSRFPYSERL